MRKAGLLAFLLLLLAGGNARAEDNRSWPNPTETIAFIDIAGNEHRVILLDGANVQLTIEAFNQSLKDEKMDGNISYCRRVIDIPVGTARGNHSYGGLCVYENPPATPKRVLICNDILVGHFKMATLKAEEDEVTSLSGFVRDNCFGG